jgi:hypothetical protein
MDLFPSFLLLNIMKRSSPASFKIKKQNSAGVGDSHQSAQRSTSNIPAAPWLTLLDRASQQPPSVLPHPRSAPPDEGAGCLQGARRGTGWRACVPLQNPPDRRPSPPFPPPPLTNRCCRPETLEGFNLGLNDSGVGMGGVGYQFAGRACVVVNGGLSG